jgi:hypothetical protein
VAAAAYLKERRENRRGNRISAEVSVRSDLKVISFILPLRKGGFVRSVRQSEMRTLVSVPSDPNKLRPPLDALGVISASPAPPESRTPRLIDLRLIGCCALETVLLAITCEICSPKPHRATWRFGLIHSPPVYLSDFPVQRA